MAQVIKDVVTWLKQWFYTEDEIDTITGGLQTQINNKADSTTVSSLSTTVSGKADKNHASSGTTYGVGSTTDYGHVKVDDAISSSSTNPVQNKKVYDGLNLKLDKAQGSSNANKNLVTDSNGNITFSVSPAGGVTKTSDLTNDGSDGTTTYAEIDDIDEMDIKLTRAYNVLGITSEAVINGATQKDFNSAVNTEINALKHIELLTVVTDANLPTASADTLNRLYVKAKTGGAAGDGYDIWVTVKTGSANNPSYAWEKIDDFDLQNLTIDWSSVTNKPSTFPPESHAHGNITSAGKIGSTNGGKPVILDSQSKVSAGEFGTTAGTFAEGNHTHSEYTNPTIANNLSTNNAAQVLSAKQGKVLNDNKADKTVAIGTTITLVDKGETNEGCIIFNTIS